MSKGIIYYTDNKIAEPIKSVVQSYILKSELPVISCSLEPMNFGQNVVFNGTPSFMTYMKQIRLALEISTADYVFFCEHDVLYPTSHFDFTPSSDSVFYYNAHVWRWFFGSDKAITYDRLISLSGLCVNRKFALDHYTRRISKGENFPREGNLREPRWARVWGYEPGTKPRRRGGFSDDGFDTWASDLPVVDIRHPGTISKNKVHQDDFKYKPTNWKEIPITEIPGWNLMELFEL